MNELVKELVHQNTLLKETIPFLLNSSSSSSSNNQPTDQDSSSSSILDKPRQTTRTNIETLLQLLDRQESRLDLLEKVGKSVLVVQSNQIPIFRGSLLPQSQQQNYNNIKNLDQEQEQKQEVIVVGIKEWTKHIQAHITKIKTFSSKSNQYETSKEIIRLIYHRLDSEPLEILESLLYKNQLLVLKQFPNEAPINLPLPLTPIEICFLFPFKLYLLRHPKAFLNLLNSKF